MLRRREVIGWLTLALGLPLALWGAGGEKQGPKAPVAQLEVQPARVEWLSRIGAERLVLVVAGPGDFYSQREFGAGETPFFSLDRKDGQLPDGDYAYELRVVSRPDLASQAPDARVQSGHLWVQGGSFVTRVPSQPTRQSPSAAKPPIGGAMNKDIVQNDDVIIQKQACIGSGCVLGDANVPALKLKELFDTRITFENDGCCHPSTRTWALQANDVSSSSGDFLIRDLTSATVPFRIGGAAPDNALTVLFNGNVGLGTSTPANHLHVFGSSGNSKVLFQEASATTAAREMLEIRNNGGSVMIFKDTSVAERWGLGTVGSSLVIDNQAHAGFEVTLSNAGNMTIAGTLTQGSSRDVKSGIVPLDAKDVLARVSALPVSLWSYKTEDAVRHVGPMAEDFHQAFGLGADDKHIAPGDQAGVALLAVQGLNAVVQDKAQEIARLRSENADLAKRVEALEAALSGLAPKTVATAGEPIPATSGEED